MKSVVRNNWAEEVVHALKSMSHEMLELSKRIGDEGSPCTPEEQKLVRLAMQPMLDEQLEILQSAAISGREITVQHYRDALRRTLEIMGY